MFAAVPPPEPAPIAAEQQGDYDCLRVATMLGKSSNNAGISPWAPRLLRIYLNRLQHADPNRDWLAAATSEERMGYGWFLPNLQRCTAPLRGGRSLRPTQAAPVTPAPTGGQ